MLELKGERVMDLRELEREVAGCTKCGLSRTRNKVVFGEGNEKAVIMFVGEGPGAQEDQEGRPFVGAAGQLLNRILAAAGFQREQVYIANVVKCRPPGNRLPAASEVNACYPYLQSQIKAINPQIIVCLGSLAAQAIIDPGVRITKIRGHWFEREGIKIMPTFHPAALLRDEQKKKLVWEDFKKIRDLYHELSMEQLTLQF